VYILHLSLKTDCFDHCSGFWNNRATLIILSFLINKLSWQWSNILQQTCIAGFMSICYLMLNATYIEWHLYQVLMPTENEQQYAVCYGMLLTAMSLFLNVYKWCHSNVIIIKFIVGFRIKFPTKCVDRFIIFWKLTKWLHFVAYLWNDPCNCYNIYYLWAICL